MTRTRTQKTFTDFRYFLALGFGSGLSPKAPGTMGTLAALPLVILLLQGDPWIYAGVTVLLLVVGIPLCDWVARDMAVKDPGCIVWDEIVGMLIAAWFLPGLLWLPLAFGLFRLFDVWKPWPVSWLDRHIAGGAGIMLDDVAAGIYSLGVLQAIVLGVSLL